MPPLTDENTSSGSVLAEEDVASTLEDKIDLRILADEVYKLLKQELIREQERLGQRRFW